MSITVLANDTDPDGDLLSVTGLNQTVNGTAVMKASGTTLVL